jgi:two-component sensor histidine kinase
MYQNDATTERRTRILERQNRALKQISRSLVMMDELSGFLRFLCNTIRDTLEARWTSLITFDLQKRTILENVFGDTDQELNPIGDFEELSAGLSGWVMRHRQATLSSGREPDPREAEPVRRKREQNRVGAVMVAPLISRDELFGTVTVGRVSGAEDFETDELELLEAVADQAAVAVKTHDLYEAQRREVAERRASEEQLRASLQDRELLLSELHHRVKNNLNVITSLMNLQRHRFHGSDERRALDDLIRRVHSVALVHEKLSGSRNITAVDVHEYLHDLTHSMLMTPNQQPSVAVQPVMEIEAVSLDLDTLIPLGLIVTELVANAVQHAFSAEAERPSVWLRFSRARARSRVGAAAYLLEVKDNGVGMKPEQVRDGAVDRDLGETEGLGLALVRELAAQLNGVLEHSDDEGTRWTLRFSPKPESKRGD